MIDRTSNEYWEKRSETYKDNINSVLVDNVALIHEKAVKDFLKRFGSMSALDVACGYGRFADCFDDYTGIDFCKNFIEIAKKNKPSKRFILGDAHQGVDGTFDIVFAVIALSSLNMTAKEFNDKWKHKARYGVIVLEVEEFYFFPKL